ncbi:MAG: asparaginase [Acidobacteria bacterium]|nr:asparaginase [Acidobacteriota bacterium]
MTDPVLKTLPEGLIPRATSYLVLTTLLLVLCSGFFSFPAFGQGHAKPVIKIVAAGGTITNTPAGRTSIQQMIDDIRKNFPETRELLESVEFEVTDLARMDSQDFSSREFLMIARTVNEVIDNPGVKGVIVTQGTYSTEETAYFLHLLVKSDKPVIIANSQRRHGTVGNDGDKNFLDAVAVILSPEAVGKGAMVVTNQTINSGREVLKTSIRPDAFVSGVLGVLGIIESDRVTFYRSPTRRHTSRSEFDINSITTLPKVEVISSYFDADPLLIRAAADLGVQGIVINGFTNGGIPYKDQRAVLEELAGKGIVIVLTARGGSDNRVPVTSHNWFVEGDNLIAHKARILLQLALTKTSNLQEIQRIFNEY